MVNTNLKKKNVKKKTPQGRMFLKNISDLLLTKEKKKERESVAAVWEGLRSIMCFNRLTVRVGGFSSSMVRGGTAEGGDDRVVVRVGVVRVVHS